MQGRLFPNDDNTGRLSRVPNSLLGHSTSSLDFCVHSLQTTAETERRDPNSLMSIAHMRLLGSVDLEFKLWTQPSDRGKPVIPSASPIIKLQNFNVINSLI